ncbi:MAG: hypothetical protein ABIY47_17275, partial [Opitutaceae bacterium]
HFLEWKRGWRIPLYPWPMAEIEKIVIDRSGFTLRFRSRSFLRNVQLAIFHSIPFHVGCEFRHYAAKGDRGRRRLQRWLGLAR